MCKVPLVTCLLLKLMEIFCLPAESNTACETPSGGFETFDNITLTVTALLRSRKLVNFKRKDCVSHVL